jgi:hypothetical protein
VKLAELDPAATVTLPGTVTFALLSESVTVNPPEGAAPVNVTVQDELPAPVTVAGEHVRLLGVTRAG